MLLQYLHKKNNFISGPPQFVISPESRVEIINQTAQFLCSANGVPTPHLAWYRDGEMLNATDRITIQMNETDSQSTLSIYNTEDTDDGFYACIAENAAGRAESSFQLTIQSMCSLLNKGLTNEKKLSHIQVPQT